MADSFPFSDYGGESLHEGKIGIIDIGSNSIRLVVYDGLKRAPLPLYNEKALCALGKGLGSSGKLHPEGIALADVALARFLAVARMMDVIELHVLATAAVRDAQDGPDFVEQLEKKYHVNITIVSGTKEARLGAFGIFAAVYAPQGLTGDLGGGSMELVSIADGALNEQATLSIGVLRLVDEAKGDRDELRSIVQKALSAEPWLEKAKFPNFYAIGGSFRTLAKAHMQKNKYPLRVLHQYTVAAKEIHPFLKDILGMKNSEVSDLPGVAGKRAFEVIPAAVVLDCIIRTTKCENIVFSTSGIREGFLFERLSPHLRHEDALLAASADLASQNSRVSGYARELFAWMSPLFINESAAQKRLRFAACTLSEIGWRIHSEYRAAWVFHRVIQSTLTGISHAERVALALSLYHRHQYKLKEDWSVLELVGEKEKLWARTVGVAANLAYYLSGAQPGNLAKAPLSLGKGEVALTFSKGAQDIVSDTVRKRLEGLGDVFNAFASKAA